MSPAVFAHGDLRLYLLHLLAEQPRHGYELIQALSDRFGGTYVPSAGTIYPRLSKLEEEGLVERRSDGRKTIYSITDLGRAEVEARRPEVEVIENGVDDSVRRLAAEVRSSVDHAMKSLRADLAAAARSARDEGPTTSASFADNPRADSRMQLQLAEAALTEFRNELRADLRIRMGDGRLEAATVALLKSELARVRQAVAESMRS
ncbi:PadR family transcriptional regulator [Naasia lichenicola]|uniref:Helix-turn-helix transcriptional regulator n=1 Tax=Naasia lichenicola TaxID=2565933 RepID=A0A4S4FK71_9MICO|nr:PadR family transcriptional regulator [Naasia lichenicola]THG29556.1 helix-turn-helix transcriptional regulator [Naasia lichenicola]